MSAKVLKEKPEGYVEPERRPRPERGERPERSNRGERGEQRSYPRRDERFGHETRRPQRGFEGEDSCRLR